MITFLLFHLELQKEFASTYYTPCNSPMKKKMKKRREERAKKKCIGV